MPIDPLKEEFVAVVTSWYTYGQKGGLVGSALPVFSTSRNELVNDPSELFPDPGYVFLVNRGSVVEWDWIIVRPKKNDKYVPGKSFYLSFDIPTALENAGPEARVASVLDVPGFDPAAQTGLIRTPVQNVLPVFYARHNRRLFGPLKRVKVNRKTGSDTIDSLQWAPLSDDSSVYEFGEDDLPRYGLSKWTYRHENPDDEPVGGPSLLAGPVTTAKSDRAHDRLSASELAEWYVRLRGIGRHPEPVMRAFKAGPELIGRPEVVRQRLRRLSTLVRHGRRPNAALMATRYMESEAARNSKPVEAAGDRAGQGDRRGLPVEEGPVEGEYPASTGNGRVARGQRKKKQIREELALERSGLAAARPSSTAEKITIGRRAQAAAADELPVRGPDDRVPAGRVAANGGTTHAPAQPPDRGLGRSASLIRRTWPRSRRRVRRSTRLGTADGLYFTRDFLANLYVTLKSSALNLIMGPPGMGSRAWSPAWPGHGGTGTPCRIRRPPDVVGRPLLLGFTTPSMAA